MNSRAMGSVIVGAVFIISMGVSTRVPAGVMPNFEDYRAAFQKNMFDRKRGVDEKKVEKAKDAEEAEQAEREQQQAEAAARASIKVVGIVRTDDLLSSIAIIEENGKQRVCRVGDTVGLMMIVDIKPQEIVCRSSSGRWVAEIQPSAPSYRAVTPQGEAAADKSRPATVRSGRRIPVPRAQVPRMARSAKFVAHVEDGIPRGLRLEEDLMVFHEGDCLTCVARQSLCTSHPRQKLWQIAQKYNTCREAMPEIDVVVERDGKELQFVLCPYI